MQQTFARITEELDSLLRGDEVYTCFFSGERSDFVRFNKAAVRQAGSVVQSYANLALIDGSRQATAELSVSGDPELDLPRLRSLVGDLRDQLGVVPEDPHLIYATDVRSSEHSTPDELPSGPEAAGEIIDAAAGRDFVGIYASGSSCAGFSNSLGQHNWHQAHHFNLDWSLHRKTPVEEAVKGGYAGFEWDRSEFEGKLALADEQLATLGVPARAIEPGRYRVYLAPAALNELVELLAWGGFGLRAHRTRTTPLIELASGTAHLHPGVNVRENTAAGVAPDFQGQGFVRPPEVQLIEAGCYRDHLVSPRSSVEYGVATNGADSAEHPHSMDVSAGDLSSEEITSELGHGIYVSNLWYMNYSDRRACRTTGMTRFATFWVEGGRIAAPLPPMRFDESLYRMLGEKLLGLTREREFLLDPTSYGSRSTRSARLPGVLVDNFTFTL